MTGYSRCPNVARGCKFEARYNVTPATDSSVLSIVQLEYTNPQDFLDALRSLAKYDYLGESCQACGAFIPVSETAV